MKKILLFGAGKSATCLIDYLVKETALNDWHLTVADGNLELIQSKLKDAAPAKAVSLDVENKEERQALIADADIVISLLPPSLHYTVARDCVEFNKHLLNASYVDDDIRAMESAIKAKGLLFLCEMGLDPGIDHMSAMQLINRIVSEGGEIGTFKSHTGGLVAPESDNNPWHYKISWNPRNVVMAGSAGAVYLEDSEIKKITYQEIFHEAREVAIPGLGQLAWYPNRDSLSYIPVYGLNNSTTFIRTTLRYPVFCEGWKYIVDAGLADDTKRLVTDGLSFKKWSASIIPFVNTGNKDLFEYLGLFDDANVPSSAATSAGVLQFLLEKKWAMLPQDKDMIVMLHEIEYEIKSAGNKKCRVESSLIVKGDDSTRTAMAKTVGLPLGIAAVLILQNKIRLSGLHIPILPAIYDPVLKELESHSICFKEKIS